MTTFIMSTNDCNKVKHMGTMETDKMAPDSLSGMIQVSGGSKILN